MAGRAEQGLAPRPARLLRGRKAVVAGANSGIGKATAIAPGRAGADAVVNSVGGAGAAEEVVAQIEASGVRAYAHEAELLELIPYRRVGGPEDIADAVVARASDPLGYVVGTTLHLDGGMTLSPGFSTGG